MPSGRRPPDGRARPTWDPCLVPLEHLDLPGPPRVRVVEILATGSNGGAQEHLFSLMSRLDTSHYEASVVALSGGSAVRKLQRHGFEVTVIDDPDDAAAVRDLTAHLAARPARRHPHPHVPGRHHRDQGRDGPPGDRATAGRTSSRPSTRRGSAPRRTAS